MKHFSKFFQDFIPQMKYLRGDIFSGKHWSELCAILQLKTKPVEKLTFGDFLGAQDAVLMNLNAIQVRARVVPSPPSHGQDLGLSLFGIGLLLGAE